MTCPGIGEIRARDAHVVSEWRGEVHLSSGEHHRPVAIHSVPGANGHAAVAFGIPGQSEPRKELVPHRTVDVFSARILRVAGKNQSRGGVLEYFAMHVLREQVEIEMLVLAAVVVRRQIRFPSHAVIQRQP